MTFFKFYSRQEMMGKWYGVVYEEWSMNGHMCCLIPFNLILRPLYLLWIWMHYFPKHTRIETDYRRNLEKTNKANE